MFPFRQFHRNRSKIKTKTLQNLRILLLNCVGCMKSETTKGKTLNTVESVSGFLISIDFHSCLATEICYPLFKKFDCLLGKG